MNQDGKDGQIRQIVDGVPTWVDPPGFTIKDSGERRQFDSGMQRDTDTGKVRYDLVFDGPLVERLAAHLTKGAVKYEARNWMKARGAEELERFRESATRHFIQYMRGDRDEDHFAATVFNLNGMAYLEEQRETPRAFLPPPKRNDLPF